VPLTNYILRSCTSFPQHSTFMPFLFQAVVILTRCQAGITTDSFFPAALSPQTGTGTAAIADIACLC